MNTRLHNVLDRKLIWAHPTLGFAFHRSGMVFPRRYTAIHLAAQKGTAALFEALLPDGDGGGLDADAKGQLLNATLEGGQTALHLAAQNCNVAAVRALLSRGASVDPVIPANGNTPLHVICKKTFGPASADDAVAIINLLVDRGADLSGANGDGDRALHLAVTSSGSKARGLKLHFPELS